MEERRDLVIVNLVIVNLSTTEVVKKWIQQRGKFDTQDYKGGFK